MQYNGKNVDPYRILGVTHDVTEEELKKKYRIMVKKYHSDVHPDKKTRCEEARREEAIRLLTEAHEEVLKDIKKREEDKRIRQAMDTNYSEMDLETLKSTLILQINNCIDEYQVDKLTCDLNEDVHILRDLSNLFGEVINASKNCIYLISLAKTCVEALKIKYIFDEKESNFNKYFFEKVPELLIESLVFIYYSMESQYVLKSINERGFRVSAREWFKENQDAFITVARYDRNLLVSLDKILDEFKEDELEPFVKEEIEATNYKIIEQINNALKISNATYHLLNEEFLTVFRETIQEIFKKHREEIEKRRNKIKDLKSVFNITEDTTSLLEKAIHDGNKFDELVNTIEKELLCNAQGNKSYRL